VGGLLVSIAMLLALFTNHFLFLLIPSILIGIFCLIYLPALTIGARGPFNGIVHSLSLIGTRPVDFLLLVLVNCLTIGLATALCLATVFLAMPLALENPDLIVWATMIVLAGLSFFFVTPMMWTSCAVVYRAMDADAPAPHQPVPGPSPRPGPSSPHPQQNPDSTPGDAPPPTEDAASRTAHFAARPITVNLEAFAGPPPEFESSLADFPDHRAPEKDDSVVDRQAGLLGFANTQQFQAFHEEEDRFQGFDPTDDSDPAEDSEPDDDSDPAEDSDPDDGNPT
jgi:hypothetical protein